MTSERAAVLADALPTTAAPADAASAAPARLHRQGIALVVVFWWVATGLIIAMQRSGPTRMAGLVIATALAALGLHEIRISRDDDSPAGVRRAFLGGALLWGWVSVTFYGGFLTGFAPTAPVAPAPAWSAVMPAIAATLATDAAALMLMVVAALFAVGARNRAGLWSLVLFWAVQQVAKINVFLGVENPAANFLPPHLAYLRQFFGPPVNSAWLVPSIAALALGMGAAAWASRRARHAGRRQAAILYATILGLAVLEVWLLGLPLAHTPWDSFLRARGS